MHTFKGYWLFNRASLAIKKMNSQVILTLVVLVAVAAHVALYRWVKFKFHEGVIIQFLRNAGETGDPEQHHVDTIAAHTKIAVGRVAVVCRKSTAIYADPEIANGWRADRLGA
jgi:hypothetical protein